MDAPERFSIHTLMTGKMYEFLRDCGVTLAAAEQVAELCVALAGYREEEQLLYPVVFLCADSTALAAEGQRLVLGEGNNPPEVMRALKKCAPLCRGGWAMFLELGPERWVHGIFRSRTLCFTPNPSAGGRFVQPGTLAYVRSLAPDVVELGGPNGRTHVHLSASTDRNVDLFSAVQKLVAAAVPAKPASSEKVGKEPERDVDWEALSEPDEQLV